MPQPDLAAVPVFYHKYIQLIKEDNVADAIINNSKIFLAFLSSIPNERWPFRYAEKKWSIKEMVQHIIDAERVFAYRALCFSRGEKASLPGFSEDDYAAASGADKRTRQALIEEITLVRKSVEMLFSSFDEVHIKSVGTANNNPVSVNAIGFIIAGHARHHMNILEERYL